MIPAIVISVLAGSSVGFIYGLLFLISRKGAPSLFTHVFLSLVRFILLMGAALYLLRLPSIQPVILVLSFLAMFWLVIIMNKASSDEGHRTFRR